VTERGVTISPPLSKEQGLGVSRGSEGLGVRKKESLESLGRALDTHNSKESLRHPQLGRALDGRALDTQDYEISYTPMRSLLTDA